MLKGKDGIDDVQQTLISFLSAIKDSEEKTGHILRSGVDGP